MSTQWYSADIRGDLAIAVRLEPAEAVREVSQGRLVFLSNPDRVHDVLLAIQRQRESIRSRWRSELSPVEIKRLRPLVTTRSRRALLAHSIV